MPFYRAEIYGADGKKKVVRREAAGENELLREFERLGCTVAEIKEEKEKKKLFRKTARAKLTLEEQQLFCATVCSFLRGGLPLAEILRLLRKSSQEKTLRAVYSSLYDSVENGYSLASAMKTAGKFRPSLIGMVESGEKSSSLADIMEKAAQLLSDEIKLRRKITSSLTYPLIMLVVGIAVLVFLLSFVVPKLTEIVVQSGAELPFVTRMLIVISKAVKAAIIPIIIALLLFVLWVKKKKKKINLPFMKNVRENLSFAMIFSQLSALTRSGIPLVSALRLTAPLDGASGRLQYVADQIEQGSRFSAALEKQGSFTEEITTIIRVGESGTDLSGTMERLGENCWDRAKSGMEKITTLAEPAIILVLGFFVGFVVLAVLLPIFDLSSLAGA